MLRKKALRKIFITTMSLFIIMTIYFIPLTEKTLETNLEFEYITDLANSSIYLLDENNYLVKTKVLLDEELLEDNIKNIISNLTVTNNSKFPDKLNAIIPKDTKLNNITNTEFYLGDASKVINNLDYTPDTIILDPPRSGISKDLIDFLLSLKVKNIIYVSCNPLTLARDINLLDSIYHLESIKLVDEFPNTYHLESITLLKLRKKN